MNSSGTAAGAIPYPDPPSVTVMLIISPEAFAVAKPRAVSPVPVGEASKTTGRLVAEGS